MGTWEDADGIDGPWERAMDAAMREDATQNRNEGDMTTYTATIDARGARSTVPDAPDAVDATIQHGDETIGEVTLLVDPYDGELNRWGVGLDNWADDAVKAHLEAMGDDDDYDAALIDIVSAVRQADSA